MNLARLLTDTAARVPDRPAVRQDDLTLTYSQLDEATQRCAALLAKHGVAPGDRVGVMLPNVSQFPVCYYAVLRAGCTVVPMNILLKAREVAYYLHDSGARVVLAWGEAAEEAQRGAQQADGEVVPVVPGDFEQLLDGFEPLPDVADVPGDATAVILYTSGTTGQPKGAELTHDNLRENAVVTAETLANLTEDDVLLGALPLFHAFGQTCALNAAMYAGSTLTMVPRFDPTHALELIQSHRATVFEGVPTMFSALLHHPKRGDYDTSSLRLCMSGGAAIPVEVLHGFEEAFGTKVLEGYGLSETSPVASFNHPDRERKPGSIGTPIKGVEMKVADDDGTEVPVGEVGQIFIRGHNVMRGYWNKPDATEQVMVGGWFVTGDVAKVDEEGYFYIVDRKKDMIIRGGYNVYPREIEEVLYEHPAVLEAAVVGVPHASLGEEVGAAVALKPGQHADAAELAAHVKAQVAAYKYPRHIWFVDALPKGPTGKILKREIALPDDVKG